jgi:hypothetical protein
MIVAGAAISHDLPRLRDAVQTCYTCAANSPHVFND